MIFPVLPEISAGHQQVGKMKMQMRMFELEKTMLLNLDFCLKTDE